MEGNRKSVKCLEEGGTWEERTVSMPKLDATEPAAQNSEILEQIGHDADSEHDVPDGYQSGWIQPSGSENEDLDVDEDGCIVDADGEEPPTKKYCYKFEVDPTARKRQCNKLLRRLRMILDEFSVRIGQQVAVIVAQPPTTSVRTIRTYGSDPLQKVITRYHPTIINELSEALASKEPHKSVDPNRFELPPLVMEGKPIPVEKMTQAQLREFIPIMLRYSTGRGKPGWGKERMRPLWWPEDIPWSNIRLDSRDFTSKTLETWSSTLRRIIYACYKFHDREDLLNNAASQCGLAQSVPGDLSEPEGNNHIAPSGPPPFEKIIHDDGTISLYVPKPADTRHVILTDTDGQEYCVEIAVPNNATSAVLANFQMTPAEAPLQQIAVGPSQVVSLGN